MKLVDDDEMIINTQEIIIIIKNTDSFRGGGRE